MPAYQLIIDVPAPLFCAIRPPSGRGACTRGHLAGNGAERPVDVRLAPTGAERRSLSGKAAISRQAAEGEGNLSLSDSGQSFCQNIDKLK